VLLVPSSPRDARAAERQLREAVGGGALASSPLARAMLARGIPTERVGLLSLTLRAGAPAVPAAPRGGGGASTGSASPAGEVEGSLGASVAAAAAGARRQLEREREETAAAGGAGGDGGLSNGAIAGVIAGVVAVVATSACLVAFVVRVMVKKGSSRGGRGEGGVEKGGGGGGGGGGNKRGDESKPAVAASTKPFDSSPFSAASAASPFANARMMPSVRPSTAGSAGGKAAAAAATVADPSAAAPRAPLLPTARSGSGSGRDRSASASASEEAAAALDVPFSELRLLSPIGEGAYGRVWLARWRETAVAVKILNAAAAATSSSAAAAAAAAARYQHRIGNGSDDNKLQQQQQPSSSAALPPLLSALRREAGIMSRLRHPNVLQYLGTVAEEGVGSGGGGVGGGGESSSSSLSASASAASACSSHPVTAVIAEYCPHGSVADLLAAAREAVERKRRLLKLRSESSSSSSSGVPSSAAAGADERGNGNGDNNNTNNNNNDGNGGRQPPLQLFELQHHPRPDARAVRAVRQWETRLALALGAAKGMLYLHSRGPAPVLHRDLKAANVLVDGSMRAKVADFNLAREGAPPSSSAGSGALPSPASSSLGAGAANNPRWLAPEVLMGQPATTASDVYSFGIFLWELACWETPWAQAPGPWAVAIGVVERAERPPLPEEVATAGDGGASRSVLSSTPGGAPVDEVGYLSLMRSCWAQDPRERPGFAEVIARLRPVAAAERQRQQQLLQQQQQQQQR